LVPFLDRAIAQTHQEVAIEDELFPSVPLLRLKGIKVIWWGKEAGYMDEDTGKLIISLNI
jgi:hypothetical protein